MSEEFSPYKPPRTPDERARDSAWIEPTGDPVQAEHLAIFRSGINEIVDRCLKGDFIDHQNITSCIRRLCTAIDDPLLISKILKSVLRKDLELTIEDEIKRKEKGDHIYTPLTSDFEGDEILNHPDAHSILSHYVIHLSGGLLDHKLETGQIDPLNAVAEADEAATRIVYDSATPADTLVSQETEYEKKLENESKELKDNAADNVRQWRLVLTSLIEATKKKDYRAEILKKANERWDRGDVTHDDYTWNFFEMVKRVGDPEKISVILKKIVENEERRHPNNAEHVKEIMVPIFNEQLNGALKKDSPSYIENAQKWLDALRELS